MKGLKIDRYDENCSLCRHLKADKTGSHLVPNFMIQSIFSFDGKPKRDREISIRDGLNWGRRKIYYGSQVSPEAINADNARDLTEDELDNNVNNLVCDNLFCNSCEKRFSILEDYYAPFYSSNKQEQVNSRVAYLFWLSVFWRMCVGRMSIFLGGEDEFAMRRILDKNITTIDQIKDSTRDLGDFGYILWRTKGLQKGDSGIYGTRGEHSPYMIVINDMVIMLVSGVSKLKRDFNYAGWQISPDDFNTYKSNGEVVNEISLEDFALLKRFVLDESERNGWGANLEETEVDIRERDRTAGKLHSIGIAEERVLKGRARMMDLERPRPLFLRNMDKFFMAEIKEYACKMNGQAYSILEDRNLFLFQFDIDNYKKDLLRYAKTDGDIAMLPYVDKLLPKRFWEGDTSYQEKCKRISEFYEDAISKGYTYSDIMNNLRTRSSEFQENTQE